MLTMDIKVLVTGAAGFIGSNLCEYLIENNYQVVGMDNLATGYLHNLATVIDNANFTFIQGDIRDLESCNVAVQGCDYVLHQAALGSVPRSINDPITSNEVNVSGFLNMLVACKDAGVKKMVYAASSSTYGDLKDLPKVEENIGKPLSPYAVTKLVNELYAGVFHDTYGLNIIGLRYFNVYGRKQDPNSTYAAVIPLFTKQLINKESPVINGDGSYSRDFTYIDNVIDANIKAMLSTNKASNNAVINIACGERTDLNTLVLLLKEILTTYDSAIAHVNPVYGPGRDGDVPHSLACIDKARKLINYEPEFKIREGLKRAIKWYWEYL